MSLILHPLVLPIAFPLFAGILCLLIPRGAATARALLAVAAAAITIAFAWPLFAGGGDLLEVGLWLALRADRLSGFVLLTISVIGFLVAAYSLAYMKGHPRHREYFAYLLWTLGAACGAVLANDLVILLVLWGFLAVTLYLMIGLAGPDAAEAARKSLMIVGGSDAVLVLGVALFWSFTGSTRMDAGAVAIEEPAQQVAFLAFCVAIFAKVGVMPFHAWVPDCGAKAPTPVAALLPASLDKLLGIYLLTRCVLDLFALTASMQTMLMAFGAVTLLAAGLIAMGQRDLKLLLSYSSISQVGYMVLAIGSGTALGLAAGLFHMLNNAIYKCCLFLGAGAVEQAAGTTDLDRLGGIAKSMPLTFAAFTVSALAISGVPPLSGFASKWMIYQSLIDAGGAGWIAWLAAAMLGSALTLAASVKALHATFLRKPAPDVEARPIREASLAMVLPMIVLAAASIVFGVFAFAIPLEFLIFPVVGAVVPGVWWSGLATALIAAAIALGALVYLLTMTRGRLRRCETYIGGERIDEVHIHGEEPGASRHVEVTGADFYRTLEQLPGLRQLYALVRERRLDVYEAGAAAVLYFIAVLRRAHSGALPFYVLWILGGLLVVLYATTQRGP